MPGSSVSACHMCHMHSHNQDNLVRTSPLRHSRGRSKSSSKHSGHKHYHGHTNSGYSSSRDEGTRVHRSNSASVLARLTDNSHSLPGSRSNSLSRYHREVSIMPDGGDTYGLGMRSSSSTRSLEMNPPMTNILDVRTTSLPRVSSILSQSHIHPQPDILVNAMPRSRTNSRSGSIGHNAVNLSQDNSHDYYLDIHRQRFKEEKRKHRFNLQTVMLIGCYTLLVMIAIIVGIVLCYQNGWFGLGPPHEKISGDVLRFNNSNSLQRDAINLNNRRKPHTDDTNGRIVSDGVSNGRSRSRNRENINNVNNINNNHRQISTDNINPGNVHQVPHRHEEPNNDQRNVRNRNRPLLNVGPTVNTAGLNNNIPNINVNSFPIQSPNVPLQAGTNTHFINENQRRLRPTSSSSNIPSNVPARNINQPQNQVLQNKQFNHNAQIPTSFPTGVPLIPDRTSFEPEGIPLIPGGLPSDIHSNVNRNNRVTVHIPTDNFRNHPSSSSSSQNKHIIRKGDVDSNTIAKTLLQARFSTAQSIRPNSDHHDSKTKTFVNENTNDQLKTQQVSSRDIFSLSPQGKIAVDSGSLTTQELLDLLAIRRMRDLLNSDGNAKSILEILRNVEPSEDMRLEAIRKETVEPNDNEPLEESASSRRGKGRSIQVSSSDNLNDLQIRRLIEAMIKDKEEKKQESSNINIQVEKQSIRRTETGSPSSNLNVDSISSNINHLINNTINGAIIRLLNKKNSDKQNDSDVDVNISGVSVFPLNSEDLKILLESNPSNVEENIGRLDEGRLKSLQILHRLIELNNLRQKVQQHVGTQQADRRSSGSTTPAERAKAAPVLISRIGIPLSEPKSDLLNSKSSILFKPRSPESSFNSAGVPLRNVTASFNRGSTLSIDETHRFSPEPLPEPNPDGSNTDPDPTFAVMVRTDGLNKPTPNRRITASIPQRTNQQIQPQLPAQIPIREEASIQPGRSRNSETKAVIRAWTHMDSEGTLSKGRIHSDGSFTFTNCRPVEVCNNNNKNNKQEN